MFAAKEVFNNLENLFSLCGYFQLYTKQEIFHSTITDIPSQCNDLTVIWYASCHIQLERDLQWTRPNMR